MESAKYILIRDGQVLARSNFFVTLIEFARPFWLVEEETTIRLYTTKGKHSISLSLGEFSTKELQMEAAAIVYADLVREGYQLYRKRERV